jgi:hypothetical protein
MLKKFLNSGLNVIAKFFVIVGLAILAAAFSLAWFSLGYWLITLILPYFFNITLPFSWTYAIGGWLIAIITGSFIAPFFRVSLNYRD